MSFWGWAVWVISSDFGSGGDLDVSLSLSLSLSVSLAPRIASSECFLRVVCTCASPLEAVQEEVEEEAPVAVPPLHSQVACYPLV